MHVRDLGDAEAPATLFLHGMTYSGACWEPYLSIPGGRVLVADFPGQGRSRSEAVVDFESLIQAVESDLLARGIRSVRLVGHSLGSYVSLALAVRRRVEVRQMVLLAPLAHLEPTQIEGFRQLAAALRGGADPVPIGLSTFYTPDFASRDPVGWARATEAIEATNVAGVIAEFDHMVTAFRDYRPELPGVRVPTVLRGGELDVSTPISVVHDLGALISGSTIEVAPGVGHGLPIEDVSGTVASLRRALR